jgi:hypothetical protein
MMTALLILGGVLLVSKLKQNGGTVPTLSQLFKPADYQPWSAPKPSVAGSSGSSSTETSPLTALMMRFQGGLSGLRQPAPYIPLSGPGGATVLPGAPSSPAGAAQNTLQPTAPGTLATYSIREDVTSASDPRYWWMMPTIDIAIMSDDLNGALAAAGDVDLSQAMIEASIGAEWRA